MKNIILVHTLLWVDEGEGIAERTKESVNHLKNKNILS